MFVARCARHIPINASIPYTELPALNNEYTYTTSQDIIVIGREKTLEHSKIFDNLFSNYSTPYPTRPPKAITSS